MGGSRNVAKDFKEGLNFLVEAEMTRRHDNLLMETMTLHDHSRAARQVAASADFLREMLNRDPRKILPVAFLARQFLVSTRLLWSWIGQGVLRTQKPEPNSAQKRGVSKQAAIRFLNRLKEADGLDCELLSRAGRPEHAKEKIRAALRNGNPGNGMTPREYAAQIGISPASVIRAYKDGLLDAWNPTPCRYLIGKRPKNSKKVRLSKKRH